MGSGTLPKTANPIIAYCFIYILQNVQAFFGIGVVLYLQIIDCFVAEMSSLKITARHKINWSVLWCCLINYNTLMAKCESERQRSLIDESK